MVRYGGVGRLWRGDNLLSEVSYQLELWQGSDGSQIVESLEDEEVSGPWRSEGTLWTGRGVKLHQLENLELELDDQRRVEIRLLSFWWQKARFELGTDEAMQRLLTE